VSLLCRRSEVLSHPTTLAFDQTLAESAAPLEWRPEFFPKSSCRSLEEIFAVWVCREGEFYRAVIGDLSRDKGHEFLDVVISFKTVPGREVEQEVGVNDLRLLPRSFVAMTLADPDGS
jgi:hypothetical protein